MMKTLIVVPAVNEEKTVGKVLTDLRHEGFSHIVLIDDGSTDKTASIATQNKVVVLKHLINRGLGAGLGTGFEYAKITDVDYLVTFDADGQHLAKDIKRLLKPLQDKKADVVIGSRLLNPKTMPRDRQILNQVSNVLTFLLYGVKSSDSLSGLRGFNKKAINSIEIKTDRMEVSNEFFREIKKNTLKLVEIPIDAIYTDYSARSSSQEPFASITIPFRLIIRMFR